jgi:hypothetical protein
LGQEQASSPLILQTFTLRLLWVAGEHFNLVLMNEFPHGHQFPYSKYNNHHCNYNYNYNYNVRPTFILLQRFAN